MLGGQQRRHDERWDVLGARGCADRSRGATRRAGEGGGRQQSAARREYPAMDAGGAGTAAEAGARRDHCPDQAGTAGEPDAVQPVPADHGTVAAGASAVYGAAGVAV